MMVKLLVALTMAMARMFDFLHNSEFTPWCFSQLLQLPKIVLVLTQRFGHIMVIQIMNDLIELHLADLTEHLHVLVHDLIQFLVLLNLTRGASELDGESLVLPLQLHHLMFVHEVCVRPYRHLTCVTSASSYRTGNLDPTMLLTMGIDGDVVRGIHYEVT